MLDAHACGCTTHNHDCPVTMKTHDLFMFIGLNFVESQQLATCIMVLEDTKVAN